MFISRMNIGINTNDEDLCLANSATTHNSQE